MKTFAKILLCLMQMYKVDLCPKELTFYKTKPGLVSVINLILQLRMLRLKKPK